MMMFLLMLLLTDLIYYPAWTKTNKCINAPDDHSVDGIITSDITKFRIGLTNSGSVILFDDIYWSGGHGYFQFKMVGTYVTSSSENAIEVNTTNSFADGDWHNVVVTKDTTSSSDGVDIYVDGVKTNISFNGKTKYVDSIIQEYLVK